MKYTLRPLRTVLTAAALSACLVVQAAAAYGVGTTTNTLRLRAAASTGSSTLATVAAGSSVTVLEGAQNGWYKVEWNGKQGYMSADYLTVRMTQTTGKLNTDGASLNMRSGPGTGYSKVASIPAGTTLTITATENGWYKTSYNGVTGYVSSTFVTLTSAPADSGNTTPSAPATPPTAETPAAQTGVLNTDGASLNMRSGPGTSYARVASIPAGTTLTITATENGWYKTNYNGVTGYVSSTFVTLTSSAPADPGNTTPPAAETPATPPAEEPPSEPPATQTGVPNTGSSWLNMRSGPGTGYNKVTSVPPGTLLTLTTAENGWYKTSYNGVTGYVSSAYIRLTDASDSGSSTDSSTREQLIAYSKQFLGIPYRYGANGPSAYDCSSFTQAVYKKFGYSLNRSAAGQYNNGTVIDQSQIQPGDLLLWRAYGSSSIATHVGIYIGNNQYIHASSTGKCITINDMSYGTSARYLVGVRRILP